MYSPADFPSRLRAAPAKKRRLSAQKGISSRDAMSGLPTLSDSSWASSSTLSSRTSASLCRSSERSFGVTSSQVSSVVLAAATARSTSPAPHLGTPAITWPVAGLITSIVSPEAASLHSPPMKHWYSVFVALIESSCSDRWYLRRFDRFRDVGCTSPQDARVPDQPLRQRDREHGHDDDEEGDDVDHG